MEVIIHRENQLLYNCFSHSVFKKLKGRITWKPYSPLYCSNNTIETSKYLKTFEEFTQKIKTTPGAFEVTRNRAAICFAVDQYTKFLSTRLEVNNRLINGYVSLVRANDRGVVTPVGLPLLSTNNPRKSKRSKPLLDSLEKTMAKAHLKVIQEKRVKLMEKFEDTLNTFRLLSRLITQYKVAKQERTEEI